MRFIVEALAVSAQKGTAKREVPHIELVAGHGIAGDAHAGPGHRQVSLLAGEEIDTMRAKGLTLSHGAFGENIVTRGIDWRQARIGGRIRIGAVELEVTQIGKECHSRCAIYYSAGECIMPHAGIFAVVLQGGTIHAQDHGDYDFR